MADEEVVPSGTPDEQKKKGPGNLVTIILIGVMVVLISLGAFFLSQKIVEKKIIKATTPDINQLLSEGNSDSKAKKTRNNKSPGPVKYVVEIKDMVINPRDSIGEHFLSLDVGIGFNDDKLQAEIESRKLQIKDRIIYIMSSLPYDIMADIRYRESVKKQLKKGINEILTQGEITDIFFTEYVLQ